MDKKEVREKAIRQIFEETSLKQKGFACTKKNIHKKENNFKFSLDFSSAISANHIEEVNIFEVRAHVSHEGLRKFKKEKFNNDNGFIGGGLIENLFLEGPPWIRYDLGITEKSYNDILEKIVKVVETDVFIFFNNFTDQQKILNYYGRPCFSLRCAIEFYLYLKNDLLLSELMEKVSIGRNENFKLNYTNFNNRRFDGETWIEVYKDVKDGEDSLCFEIANSFFDMGIKI